MVNNKKIIQREKKQNKDFWTGLGEELNDGEGNKDWKDGEGEVEGDNDQGE